MEGMRSLSTAERVSGCNACLLIFLLCGLSMKSVADIKSEFETAYRDYTQLLEQKQYEQAVEKAALAYELGEELFGESHNKVAALCQNYGHLLRLTDKQKKAQEVLARCLKVLEKQQGKEDIQLVDILMELGHAKIKFAETSIAANYYKRAVAIAKKNDKSVLVARLNMEAGSRIQRFAGNGRHFLEEALEIYRTSFGQSDTRTGIVAFNLGKYHLAQGGKKGYQRAEGYFKTAITAFTLPDGRDHKWKLMTDAFMVKLYEEMGDSAAATEHLLAIGKARPIEPNQSYTPLYKKPPDYPRRALRKRKSGWVVVEFEVDHEGFVRDPRVVKSSDSVFNQSAVDSATTFRYAPRFINGKPVTTEKVQNKIRYEIVED